MNQNDGWDVKQWEAESTENWDKVDTSTGMTARFELKKPIELNKATVTGNEEAGWQEYMDL